MATAALKGKARAIVAAPLLQQVEMLRASARVAQAITRQLHSTTSAASTPQSTTASVRPSYASASASASTSAAAVAPASASRSAHTTAAPAESAAGEAIPIESTAEALNLLRSQRTHYVVASVAGRTLTLHERDLFTLPRLNDLQVGDVIELNRVHEVGSRDYTLRAQDPMSTRQRGAAALLRRSNSTTPQLQTNATGSAAKLEALSASSPAHFSQSETVIETTAATVFTAEAMQAGLQESQSWAARLRPGGLAHVGAVLDPSSVRVRCTVVEHTKGPMEFIVKFKRRKGYRRTIKHKQTYTRLRVEAIQLGNGVAQA